MLKAEGNEGRNREPDTEVLGVKVVGRDGEPDSKVDEPVGHDGLGAAPAESVGAFLLGSGDRKVLLGTVKDISVDHHLTHPEAAAEVGKVRDSETANNMENSAATLNPGQDHVVAVTGEKISATEQNERETEGETETGKEEDLETGVVSGKLGNLATDEHTSSETEANVKTSKDTSSNLLVKPHSRLANTGSDKLVVDFLGGQNN
mmetsp:Transcript_19528/g.35208  ORF Transcript_19528/g.35208 Transcript_19528/m.35208 type:complete len:205 (+) Transcript_19528:899-1513(+)